MARRTPPRIQVLNQAIADVKDREPIYGPADVNHARVARLWAAYCNCKANPNEVDPVDSIMFQILTNIARLIETPSHKGSWDNIAGYAGIGYEVKK